jgi:hypothetical protein
MPRAFKRGRQRTGKLSSEAERQLIDQGIHQIRQAAGLER